MKVSRVVNSHVHQDDFVFHHNYSYDWLYMIYHSNDCIRFIPSDSEFSLANSCWQYIVCSCIHFLNQGRTFKWGSPMRPNLPKLSSMSLNTRHISSFQFCGCVHWSQWSFRLGSFYGVRETSKVWVIAAHQGSTLLGPRNGGSTRRSSWRSGTSSLMMQYLMTRDICPWGHLCGGPYVSFIFWEVVGSIPGRVIPKTLKLY